MKKGQEPTNYEILKAVNKFATHTEQQFQVVKSEMGEMKPDIGGIKADIGKIKANMVTKDYLDDKLADLRGDLVVLMRKEDIKIRALVEILRQKNILTKEEEKKVLTMQPFPRLYV